ncbi:MAG: NADPH:quinone oxidoreductase family protein [Chloroflexota bacterium]
MKAVLCQELGPPEKLVIADVPSPMPGEDEIKIAVHACGLNFADTLIIEGKYQERPELPFTPGSEVGGEVIEVGAGVTTFKPGDRVMARCKGGYAEEAIAPVERTLKIPDSMGYDEAAGFAVAYGTSHVGLARRANLQPGEVLLVHGASGGVGLAAVDIGKAMGATVIATASTEEKLALAKDYGADHLINYTDGEFRHKVKEFTDGRGADVIYDPVGGDVFDQSLRCINWEGRIIIVGFASGRIPKAPMNIVLVKNISLVGLFWGNYGIFDPATMRHSMEELAEWYQAGKLKPHISGSYPLEQVADALNTFHNRAVTGKIVLKIR